VFGCGEKSSREPPENLWGNGRDKFPLVVMLAVWTNVRRNTHEWGRHPTKKKKARGKTRKQWNGYGVSPEDPHIKGA